jgi:hypothetical protein
VAFALRNTGTAPESAAVFFNRDIYRLRVSVQGAGWSAQLLNALAAVKFGDAQSIPVYLARSAGSAATATVTLTAVSESDPAKTASAVCRLTAGGALH